MIKLTEILKLLLNEFTLTLSCTKQEKTTLEASVFCILSSYDSVHPLDKSKYSPLSLKKKIGNEIRTGIQRTSKISIYKNSWISGSDAKPEQSSCSVAEENAINVTLDSFKLKSSHTSWFCKRFATTVQCFLFQNFWQTVYLFKRVNFKVYDQYLRRFNGEDVIPIHINIVEEVVYDLWNKQ